MNRSTLPQLARVIVVVVMASVAVSGAPSVKQVHPQTGGGNAPVLIAVVADHYAAGEEQEFNHDVENFFKYGLLADDYFKQKGPDLKVVSYFEATPAGQQSRYAFTLAPGVGNCAVAAGTDGSGKTTAQLIEDTLGNASPVHTVVIGNHPYNFGCTDATWTYVAVDAVGTDVLQHEFGHVLAGLFDEWSMPQNLNVAYPGVIHMSDNRNCWPTMPPAAQAPHWENSVKQFKNFQNLPGCDLFGQQVIHPYEFCRMGTKHDPMHPGHPVFCPVCEAAMDDTFDFYRDWRGFLNSSGHREPATGPSARHEPSSASPFRIMNAALVTQQPVAGESRPIPIVRLLVQFDPAARTISVKQRTSATGVYVPSYRRVGRFAYELTEGNKTIEVGVIPDHLFEARGYRGGPVHATSAPKAAEIVIQIPNETVEGLQGPGRNLQLVIYELSDRVPGRFITPGTFQEVRKAAERVAGMAVK